MYRLASSGVIRLADGEQVTRQHSDWAAYLEWLSAGGVPQPPEAVVAPELLPQVPRSVSRFQARAALELAGLLADAEAAIAEAHPLSRIAWNHAQQYRRDSPTVISIGNQLGLTDAELDELFQTAASITA